MKKIILLAVFCLLTGLQLYAQKLNIGVYVSPATTWLRSDQKNIKADGGRLGFDYGLMLEYKISERYLFSSGLNVSYRGGSLKYTDTLEFESMRNVRYPHTTLVDYRLQYLEVPLNLRLRATEVGKVIPFAQFGFNPGFRLSAKADITPPPLSAMAAMSKEKVNKDAFLFSFGLVIGGGVEYKLTEQTRAMASLLFYNGFLNTVSNKAPDSGGRIKPNSVALRLGIFF